MRNRFVYDLPVRVFHLVFAGLFVSSFLIANTVDDESRLFSYHMLAGILLAPTVLLRILWGFIGSQNARFNSFALHPGELVSYIRGVLSGDRRKWGGHNPASSWSAIFMMALALGLGLTGMLMSRGYKETLEDVHELMANAFLIVVLLHVAGVIVHSLRHRDGIMLSMLDGRKSGVPVVSTITRPHSAAAVIFVLIVMVCAGYLQRNFDGPSRTLKIFGSTFELGETEKSELDDD